ncbi:MAG: phenylalanine--tRNA ligase subunit beta, partial [Deltaproteobacteria bacterium]
KLTMAGLEVEAIEGKDGDFVYSIEVTSNRPDWLSILGIAREAAAITGKQLKVPSVPSFKLANKEPFEIKIEDKKDCPLYTGRLIRGIRGGFAPEWMRKRLELVGVRPVNNIVDITNYVLFELGEPLHAFDLDKLEGGIIVRRARAGEKMTAIDGKEYTLDPGVLVIADSKKPVAIAGVMGGKDTEVTASTKNVLLEAALFDPVLVRRGRQKLGLASEASYRFERGIDPQAPDEASRRAVQLILEIAGGSLTGEKSAGSSAEKTHAIALDTEKTCRVLGACISPAEIKQILTRLGFCVKPKGGKMLSVEAPSFRRDVKSDVDLIEEVARIYGFEEIPSCLPAMAMQVVPPPSLIPAIKGALAAQGLDEVLTYSLIDRKYGETICAGADLVEVAKPLSNEQEIMRPSLVPSLCRVVAYNLNQRREEVGIYEIARTYAKPDKEHNTLGIAVSGTFTKWLGPQGGSVSHKAGFLDLKGVVDAVLRSLGISENERVFAYADNGIIINLSVKDQPAGVLRKLSQKEQDLFEIKDRDVFCAELSLDRLLPLATRERIFKPFSKFPSIVRDVTLELSADIPVEKILACAKRSGKGLMQEARFIDYYDKNLPKGTKRITISMVYSAPDRTLTEAEISPVNTSVIEALKAEFSAK